MRLELKEPDASSSAEEDGRGGLSVEVDDEHVEAQHGQLRELFDKIKEEDGKLRPAELAQLAQELEMQLSQSQLDEAMAQMDRDGDGAVEWPEFLGWVQSKVVDVSGGLTPVRGVRRSVNPIIVAESQQQQQQRAVSSAASARSVTFDPQLGSRGLGTGPTRSRQAQHAMPTSRISAICQSSSKSQIRPTRIRQSSRPMS